MKSIIKEYLIKANENNVVGKYNKALEFFKKAYDLNPDEFTINQKFDYAWTIYRVHIKYSKDKEEIIENATFITQLVLQRDLNRFNGCVYTSSVFKLLNCFDKNEEYDALINWAEKLDVELLDENSYRKYGRVNKSKKEKYYDWLSKSYLKVGDFEKCIEVSKNSLNTFKTFLDDGNIWLKWRIAKSHMNLNQFNQALEYYNDVIEVKHNWYMYRDIAQIYYWLDKPYIALEYLSKAIFSKSSKSDKASIYYLCYKVFSLFNPEMALKHAQLYYLLQKELGYAITYDIKKLNINEENLNKNDLESEILSLWTQYKFKDQKRHEGIITKFFEDKNYGFIKTANDSIFFHKSDFISPTLYVGQKVSFYIETTDDSTKAVNIKVIES